MGIEEGTSSNRDSSIWLTLQTARQQRDETKLFEIFSFNGSSVIPTVFNTSKALDYPDTDEHILKGYAAMMETASRIYDREQFFGASSWFTFMRTEHASTGECLFDLHIQFGQTHPRAELFEVGFLYDEQGSLLVKKVQKDRHGLPYRSAITSSFGPYNRKLQADTILRDIQFEMSHVLSPKSYHAHIFGLLSTIAYLGKTGNGILLFPTVENQPDIRERMSKLSNENHVAKAWRVNKKKRRKLLRWQINNLKPLCDYSSMLQEVGVSTITAARKGYWMVLIDDVFKQAEAYFFDTQFPGRKLLWNYIQEIREAS